ncbi:MAG: efflux RND transporter periplasmic adaptor subunit [Granulosicoccus sp.]
MRISRELLGDLLWSLVALSIIAAGAVGFKVMGALQKPVEAQSVERAVAVVETQPLEFLTGPVPVRGTGFVSPVRQVALSPLTSGRVTQLHSEVTSLGHVKKGETLVQLDDRSARAELSRRESEIASTQARLSLVVTQLERSRSLRRRGVISQDELDQLEAQQTELMAALSSAESARVSAEINLEQMQVVAPFDARVMSRQAEVGDVIAAGYAIAELYSDDKLEVTVPLAEKEAVLIPGLLNGHRSGAGEGQEAALAKVIVEFGGQKHKWNGSVARVAGMLDSQSRLLDVTVTLDTAQTGTPTALVNSFATVTIDGVVDSTILQVPASALRDGNTLWLALAGKLEIRQVDVLHIDRGIAFIQPRNELSKHAQLITSTLDVPVNGMAVQSATVPLGALTLNP